jgi:hypothetical protein
MCLIILSNKDKLNISEEDFSTALKRNDDGMGAMWVDNGRVQVEKAIDIEEQKRLFNRVKNIPNVAIHIRFTTHGENIEENIHPYKVLDKDEHGIDLYMMHNGVIQNVSDKSSKYSDTWHFVNDYLRPILVNNPMLYKEKPLKRLIEDFIGYSKLLFMDSDGHVEIYNESKGHHSTKYNCWLSNVNSLPSEYPVKNYPLSSYYPKTYEDRWWDNMSKNTNKKSQSVIKSAYYSINKIELTPTHILVDNVTYYPVSLRNALNYSNRFSSFEKYILELALEAFDIRNRKGKTGTATLLPAELLKRRGDKSALFINPLKSNPIYPEWKEKKLNVDVIELDENKNIKETTYYMDSAFFKNTGKMSGFLDRFRYIDYEELGVEMEKFQTQLFSSDTEYCATA